MKPLHLLLPSLLFFAGTAVNADPELSSVELAELPVPGSSIVIGKDKRAYFKEKYAEYKKKNWIELEAEHKSFVESRLEKMTNKTSKKAKNLQKLLKRSHSVLVEQEPSNPPVPGGVGYGVFWDNNSLFWNGKTCVYHDYIVPKTPGGDVTTWLYNTSTNRANLGVEAFMSYYAQNDVKFKVFEWALSGVDPWQLEIPYSDLGDYLINRENADGVVRQQIQVVNCTSGATTNWKNEVWLRNQQESAWDYVYSYDYTTANAAENTYQAGEHYGSWGPIFETFQDHEGSNKVIGVTGTWLLQDGNWQYPTSANSNIRIDDADLNPPVFQVDNARWGVGSTAGEFSNSYIDASEIVAGPGSVNGTSVSADASDASDWILWGGSLNFGNVPAAGDYVIQFDLSTATTGSDNIAMLGLYNRTTNSYTFFKWISLSEFNAINTEQPFRYEVTLDGSENLVPGVYFVNNGQLTVERVTIAEN